MIALETYPAVRTGSADNPIVRDVESHLSLKNYNYFKGDTPTTTVHECTHGINADLRNKFFPAQRVNCFYLLRDNYISFNEPNWRKREVIPFIPQEYKSGPLYTTYVSGSNWDDRPLYLWDEWVAYINGAMLGEMYSINFALIFGFYAGSVLKKEMNFGLLDLFDLLCFTLEPKLRDSAQRVQYDKLRTWMGLPSYA